MNDCIGLEFFATYRHILENHPFLFGVFGFIFFLIIPGIFIGICLSVLSEKYNWSYDFSIVICFVFGLPVTTFISTLFAVLISWQVEGTPYHGLSHILSLFDYKIPCRY